jgi:hypothetical protein
MSAAWADDAATAERYTASAFNAQDHLPPDRRKWRSFRASQRPDEGCHTDETWGPSAPGGRFRRLVMRVSHSDHLILICARHTVRALHQAVPR